MKRIRKIKICDKILRTDHIIHSIYGRAKLIYIDKSPFTKWLLTDFKSRKHPRGIRITVEDKRLVNFIKPQLQKVNT